MLKAGIQLPSVNLMKVILSYILLALAVGLSTGACNATSESVSESNSTSTESTQLRKVEAAQFSKAGFYELTDSPPRPDYFVLNKGVAYFDKCLFF